MKDNYIVNLTEWEVEELKISELADFSAALLGGCGILCGGVKKD